MSAEIPSQIKFPWCSLGYSTPNSKSLSHLSYNQQRGATSSRNNL